jgi:hypothetical protein
MISTAFKQSARNRSPHGLEARVTTTVPCDTGFQPVRGAR